MRKSARSLLEWLVNILVMLVCAGIGIGIFLLLGKKEWVEKTSLEVVVLVGVVAIFVVALTVCFLIHGIRRYVRCKGKPSGKV